MYNRYIPQSDGSFQRNQFPDKSNVPRPVCHPPQRSTPPSLPPCREEPEPHTPAGIGKFLRNLLPKDFDTEDLLVILLFLLMSKDKEDSSSALLTMALYLFM